ncbi:transient receptor potential ion channel [Colletotrichum orchidophilum]|uniref:Transient receptor potential ion channel n=1 Tax=Colletotrichum orchidophilum TaxID=1209926 RepID=A0A1G4BPV5_9PEZI|nr:transient receptor potential ion channel [Colletotrichum orchidophilum]OHF03345.1 transient receptor potential ion channel [Colletotrichum orchidophilum]
MARFEGSASLATALLVLFSFLATALAATETVYITGSDKDGNTKQLAVNRNPGLYTGDFGDCLGGQSLFNITKFDASYYADNMTVQFHLDGTTNIKNESLMMHINVEAYGETRFDMSFDPCMTNIASLCPLNASVPIAAFASFRLTPAQIDGIPSIALDIPDFEGTARIQIFANSSRTQIGCFQAVMRNGNSFSHPAAISSILGVFTLAAILASAATAMYGVSIPHVRTHYAHSLSVLVIFETYQTVFFSGALSVDWPSVLPAWWSNFGWAAGMIYSEKVINSIDGFAGVTGNASQVGGAGSTVINTGGGLIQQIYGRSLETLSTSSSNGASVPNLVQRAARVYNTSNPYEYYWAGDPVAPGMPTPGKWIGFAGDLSALGIPAADAFTLGLIWWLVAIGLVAVSIIAFKFMLDMLVQVKLINQDRFLYFRNHLGGYLAVGVLRTLLVSFFSLMTLALLQFNIRAPAGPTAVAAIIFIFLLIGVGGLVAYACFFRLRLGKYEMGPDTIIFEQGKLFGSIPAVATTRASDIGEKETTAKRYGSIPFFKIRFIDDDPNRTTVHQDEVYIKRFGWLSARYRRTRWWFFACWLTYQFIRACFIGGGARSPLAQVYGLFVFEIIAFVVFVKLNPFESQRNTSLAIWMLGITKIVTAGFSIAFLPAFAIGGILSTVFGIIIIVVQGFLVVAVLILVILCVVSSWMSLYRNREQFPEALDGVRIKYYEHIQARATDLPPPPKPEPTIQEPQEPPQPYFSVNSVRRNRKIEDDDEGDQIGDIIRPHNASVVQFAPGTTTRRIRTNSVSSRYSVGSLPRRARPHRTSWSSADFAEWDANNNTDRPASSLAHRSSFGHQRNGSLRQMSHSESQPDLARSINNSPAPARSVSMSNNELRRLMTPTEEVPEENVMTPGHMAEPEKPSAAKSNDTAISPIHERDEHETKEGDASPFEENSPKA